MLYLKTIFYTVFVFSFTFLTDLFVGITESTFIQMLYWGLLIAVIVEWIRALANEPGKANG